ncbi:MAG: TolC family protein [Phycisphaerae bacterium]|nr:TolC family protein [Phycisphaerae bacterium]
MCRRWFKPVWSVGLFWLGSVFGCSSANPSLQEGMLTSYEERSMAQAAEAEEVADFPKIENRRPAMPVGSLTTTKPSIAQALEWQMPDPSVAKELFQARAKNITDERRERDYARTSKAAYNHLVAIQRPRQMKLTLADAIHRGLVNSYVIKIAGYEPAVSTAQIVEAEAQFDASFYANWIDIIQDQATASALQGTSSKRWTLGTGIRKLLSTGTQVDIGYNASRTETDLSFQSLNPSYNNDMTIQLVQPFLRNFGIDFNRSQINIRKNERRINFEKFRQQVRDTLSQVEQAYWNLVQKRRDVTITSELLAETEETYRYIDARRDFDAFAVLINNSKSAVDLRNVDLIRAIAAAKEAEDQLKALINDPKLNLSDDVEIVPVDIPEAVPLVVDRLAEIQAALDHRSELKQRELEIETARIIIGTAKNQVLPKFDAIFTYKITGLGPDWDRAFRQAADNDFNEYQVGVQFEWPIGSRKSRAALKQAKLRYEQTIAARKAQIEQIILDVNSAVRTLNTAQDAIYPAMDATDAAEKNVQATKERAERKSPSELQTELAGQENLAQARRTFLQALIAYNVAIAELERAKGLLLHYNNVVLEEKDY